MSESMSPKPLDFATIRDKLPKSLILWRELPTLGPERKDLWNMLRPYFEQLGYTFYTMGDAGFFLYAPRSDDFTSTGFMSALPQHGYSPKVQGSINHMLRFNTMNPLLWAARTSDGRDVIIRPLAIGEDGREHVEILRMVAAGPRSLQNMNHTLPLITTIIFDNITFGVFPRAGWSLRFLYEGWAFPSIGDVLNVIVQCLEGLVYLHKIGIAHRDAFKDNFLMQWCPEALVLKYLPPAAPRVYINDFEQAVYFPPEIPSEQRLSTGPPVGGSVGDKYSRSMPPEVLSGKPYCPFKLDVWQLGHSFKNFYTTIGPIDHMLTTLIDPDPAVRPSAFDALYSLQSMISMIPPANLLCPPMVQAPDDTTWVTKESEDTNDLDLLDATHPDVDQVSL